MICKQYLYFNRNKEIGFFIQSLCVFIDVIKKKVIQFGVGDVLISFNISKFLQRSRVA